MCPFLTKSGKDFFPKRGDLCTCRCICKGFAENLEESRRDIKFNKYEKIEQNHRYCRANIIYGLLLE